MASTSIHASPGCPWLEKHGDIDYVKLVQPNSATYRFDITDGAYSEESTTLTQYYRLRVVAIGADGLDIDLNDHQPPFASTLSLPILTAAIVQG